MRNRVRWVGAVVVVSALTGIGAAAVSTSPAASSAATTSSPSYSATSTPDQLAHAITVLSGEARQLGTEIVVARGRLVQLQYPGLRHDMCPWDQGQYGS